MSVIDCHEIRGQILTEAKKEIEALPTKPKLTIITIGEDDASKVYVRNKIKTATSLGIEVKHVQLDGEIGQKGAERIIIEESIQTDAIMLQLPIPKHLDEKILINLIPQEKDVDGLTDLNMGMLVNNHPYAIVPATAMGVYKIISHVLETGDLTGVDVTVVNRSQLIGKPLQALLTNHNATVTVCHSRTDNLQNHTSRSHIVVTGIGQPKYFDSYYFSDYQMIIDCGMNRDEENKLCGDVDVDEVQQELKVHVTPTPGGTGILTTACLMLSVIHCYNLQH
jgi:methylenetetrahydrofolate dehydrogenase (NADP+)/methenyltetrahydrofolate cyclohydrolase